MIPIAFKDGADGFYQCEVADENEVPAWAAGMTRLTEAERVAELAKIEQSAEAGQ